MINIKKLSKTFINKHKLTSVDYSVLKNTAINMGYTVIEFNSIFNEKDVETVIRNLELSENVLKSRGFTYVSADYRLIFVKNKSNICRLTKEEFESGVYSPRDMCLPDKN